MIPPIYATLVADPVVSTMTGGRIRQDVGNPDEGAPYIVWGLLSATPEMTTQRRAPADRCSISIDVFARDEVLQGRDVDENRQVNLQMMSDSKQVATQVISHPLDCARRT